MYFSLTTARVHKMFLSFHEWLRSSGSESCTLKRFQIDSFGVRPVIDIVEKEARSRFVEKRPPMAATN